MAIKRYLIAPDPNQRYDSKGNPIALVSGRSVYKVSGLVTQGRDPKYTPVPIKVPASWWYGNDSGALAEGVACDAWIRKIGGKFDGVTIGLASTPEQFTTQTEQNTSKESPVGSLQPVVAFSSTGARTMSFSFQVYGDYLPKLPNGTGIAKYNVVSYCKLLQQFALPTQNENVVIPPIVEFHYGGIHILGVFKCDTTFGSTTTNKVIDRATVSIQITETEKIINGEVFI